MKVIFFFVASALLIGALIYFPLRLVARRFASSRPRNYLAQNISPFDAIVATIIVALLFGGFSMGYIAPASWLGKLVSNWTGMLAWAGIVYLLARCFTIVSWKLRVRSQRSALTAVLNADPVEPWSVGAFDDRLLSDTEAYSIELFNDDTTSMNFVVNVLRSCCSIPQDEAVKHMLAIHNSGASKVGRLSQLHAQQLVEHIKAQATKRNFPFRCEVIPWISASS